MSDIAIPVSLPGRKWLSSVILATAVAVVGVGGYAGYQRFVAGASNTVVTGDFVVVAPGNLDVRIVKDGELQAVNNLDIMCEVEGQSTITHLVNEGEIVKKGDVLVTLDSSAIKEKIDDTQLQLQTAESDVTAAKEFREIQESQNQANEEAADVAVQLAKLDMKEYAEGTYPQSLSSAQTDVQMDTLTLKNAEDDLDQTKKLFGKGFVTAADIKKSELALTTAQNTLDKAVTALKVLTDYQHQMDSASKENALAQAEKSMVRTKQQDAANLAQKVADVQAKGEAYSLLKRKVDDLTEQFGNCTIKAPSDGLVVYAASSDRNQQTPFQEGATVRERQPLLRVPDTSSMKAVIRIQEGSVPKLKVGQRAMIRIVGVPDPVGATLTKVSVLPDNSQRWWNPDLKEYPVELTLDATPAGMKPGVGMTAELFVNRLTDVLTVPLPAIYSAGDDSYVFVRAADGSVKPLKVAIGVTNETAAEIQDGLTSGLSVLVLQAGQGRDLLEKAGITVSAPTTRPSGDHQKHKKPITDATAA